MLKKIVNKFKNIARRVKNGTVEENATKAKNAVKSKKADAKNGIHRVVNKASKTAKAKKPNRKRKG